VVVSFGSSAPIPAVRRGAIEPQSSTRHGLKRVEGGAQGPHKLQRGYLPVPTYSAHWIPDPGFRRAVASFLAREREMVAQKIEHLAEFSPFRHED
jgi:predicted N-acyltransferase